MRKLWVFSVMRKQTWGCFDSSIYYIYLFFLFIFSCLFSTSSWRNYIDCTTSWFVFVEQLFVLLLQVLLMLRQWDSCVYASEVKSTMDDALSALRWYSLGVSIVQAIYQEYYGKNKETRFGKKTKMFPKAFKRYGTRSTKVLILQNRRSIVILPYPLRASLVSYVR